MRTHSAGWSVVV